MSEPESRADRQRCLDQASRLSDGGKRSAILPAAQDPGGHGLIHFLASPRASYVTGAVFAADAKGLLKAAIRDPNPIIFLENEILYGRSFPVPKLDDFVLPIGRAKVIRQGSHVN